MLRILFTAMPPWYRAEVSHATYVGIQVDDNKVLAAEEDGIGQRSMGVFLGGGERKLIYVFEALPEAEKKLEAWTSLGAVNAKYGFDRPSWFTAPLRWLKLVLRSPLSEPRAMLSSEFVLGADVHGALEEWRGLDRELATPDILARAMLKGGPNFRRTL